MKRMLATMLIAAPGLSGAQALLDFHNNFAFPAGAVEAVAERTYRARLRSFAEEGRLDVDAKLLGRLRRLVAGLDAAVRFEQSRADAARAGDATGSAPDTRNGDSRPLACHGERLPRYFCGTSCRITPAARSAPASWANTKAGASISRIPAKGSLAHHPGADHGREA